MGTLTVGSDKRFAVDVTGANRLLERCYCRYEILFAPTIIEEEALLGSLARSNGIAIEWISSAFYTLPLPNFFSTTEPLNLPPDPTYDTSVFVAASPLHPTSRSSLVTAGIDDLTLFRMCVPNVLLPFFLQQLFLPHFVMKAHTAMQTTTMARIGRMTSLLMIDSSSFS